MLTLNSALSAQTGQTRPLAGLSRVPLSIYARESRIGRKPVPVPKGVTVTIDGQTLKVKGPLGVMEHTFTQYVKFEQSDGIIKVSKAEETRQGLSQHGLARTLTSNMVVGVSQGFTKVLELVGTGYRASVAGRELTLNVGYSNPRVLPIPEGLKVTVDKGTTVAVSGYDKVVIGDFAARVRKQREPEPYKGKGVRYLGEVIKLKEGKSAAGKKK